MGGFASAFIAMEQNPLKLVLLLSIRLFDMTSKEMCY
jgi:hypothetical protein